MLAAADFISTKQTVQLFTSAVKGWWGIVITPMFVNVITGAGSHVYFQIDTISAATKNRLNLSFLRSQISDVGF